MTDECKNDSLIINEYLLSRVCVCVFQGVENLTRRAVRLRVLDLSDSSLITEKSVHSVLRNCQYLEHVAFSRCYAIAPIAYA